MTLFDLWHVMKRYRWLVLGSSFGIALLAAIHSFFITPVYSAKVLMSPVIGSEDALASRLGPQLGSLIGLAGVSLGTGGASRSEAIAVLRSREFTEQFIQDRGLLPVLFSDRWDAEHEKWLVDLPEEIPTLHDAYEKFDRHVRFVSEDEETGLVSLEIRWTDRNLAADWANDLVRRLNRRLRDRTISEAEKSLDYLNGELQEAAIVELRQSISRLIEHNISHIMVAKGREEFTFRVIDPAVPPDPDKYMAVHRSLRIAIGLIVGFMLGMGLAFLHFFTRQPGGQPVQSA